MNRRTAAREIERHDTGHVARELDLVNRRLLNVLQSSFPLVEEPFCAIGRELGIRGSEAIERVKALKAQGVLREISAIFDTRRLGYRSTLVAMRIPPARLDAAAQTIGKLSGVSHNYARNGPFNLWFTLAVPSSVSLERTVDGLAQRTEARGYHLLPAIRTFKIGVNFDMVKGQTASSDRVGRSASHEADGRERDAAEGLTGPETGVVRELQEDLPLEPRPFDGMAARLGVPPRGLFEVAASFAERGIMRRYGAVLHHRRAGFKANAITVWRVPRERSAAVGAIMAGFPFVTHCYERPTFPDWPYTHFAMVHMSSAEACEQAALEISEATGLTDYMLLYSTHEYKKTRVRYFV